VGRAVAVVNVVKAGNRCAQWEWSAKKTIGEASNANNVRE